MMRRVIGISNICLSLISNKLGPSFAPLADPCTLKSGTAVIESSKRLQLRPSRRSHGSGPLASSAKTSGSKLHDVIIYFNGIE